MLRVLVVISAAFFFHSASQVALAQEALEATEKRLRVDLEYLADDAREGRGVGTKGLEEAGEYIARRFQELGLDTRVFGGSPFQDFTVPFGFAISQPTGENTSVTNYLKIESPEPLDLILGSQFTPLALGSNAEFTGELAFVGFGITAKDFNYDDFADIDVKGKVVIALRREPTGAEGASILGGNPTSRFAYFSTKEANAYQQGVAALILVNDAKTAAETNDSLLGPQDAGRPFSSMRVPTLFASRAAIDPIIQKATGKTLEQLEKQIQETGKPASQILNQVKVRGQTEIIPNKASVRNVAALLPGSGQLAGEYVVVGAHYDHVGMGGEGSLAPGTIEVHNGADDNASGTVGLLELARVLAQNKAPDRRSILFIAFSAEERGLLGSEHYTRYPAYPLEQTVAMVNLDMVGRVGDGAVTVFGLGTAKQFPQWLDQANQSVGLELDKQNAGYGPSDHESFYKRDIPVFHFFTGLHGEYHRPGDDAPLIDFNGLARVTNLASELIATIATSTERPLLIKTQDRARIGPNPGRRRVTLGVSYDASADRCLITGVTDPSPAKSAGLQPGDVIVKINDRNISNGEALVRAIRQFQPKAEITIHILRGDQSVELKAKL